MAAALCAAPPLTWVRLRWPRTVDADDLGAALLLLNGLSTPRRRHTFVLRAVGTHRHVEHRIGLPTEQSDAFIEQLGRAIPAIAFEPVNDSPLQVTHAWQLWVSSNRRPLGPEPELSALAVLGALSSAARGQRVIVDLQLGPSRRAQLVPTRPAVAHEGLGLLRAPFAAPPKVDYSERKALEAKIGEPGWQACVRVGVAAASTTQATDELRRVAGALRTAQGPGVQLGLRRVRPDVISDARLPLRWPLLLNLKEVLPFTAWPVGPTQHLPVLVSRSQLLPPDDAISTSDRVVAHSTYPGQERALALPIEFARMHTWLIGATGSGKSTVALNLLCNDMANGRSVVVVEPRGDLVEQVLERVPADRLDDVVVIDPADSAPVGVNPLADRTVEAEVIVDGLVHLIRALSGDLLGPRSEDVLTNALLTLARQPEPFALPDLPRVLTDEAFRRQLLNHLADRVGVDGFWQWYDALGPTERAAVIAPLMNKIRRFLVRAPLRRTLGQRQPRFNIDDVFRHRQIVLVNLNEGLLGAETANLLGAVFVNQLWQAAQRRVRVAPERRHVVHVVLDELQRFVRLPADISDVLTQARALGIAITAANQHLGQLPVPLRSALLSNARSKVVMNLSYEDAAVLTRHDSRLDPADVVDLGRFHAYVSLMTAVGPSPYVSARTLPPPPKTMSVEVALDRSRSRWGVPGADIDADLARSEEHRNDVFGIRTREDE
jgi:hypothetical protein